MYCTDISLERKCPLFEHVLNLRRMIGLQVDSKLFEKLLKENLPALRYIPLFTVRAYVL